MKPRNDGSRKSQRRISTSAEHHQVGEYRSDTNKIDHALARNMVKAARRSDRKVIEESIQIEIIDYDIEPVDHISDAFKEVILSANGKTDIKDYNCGINLGEILGTKINE